MILSEFAGAAQSLNGSIVVNPWDSQQVADAIHEAVSMPTEVRAENHRKLFKYVNKYNAAFWGTSFVREMLKIAPGSDDTLTHDDKAGQGVLQPGSAGGTGLPSGLAPVEIDRSELPA
jgi:trehalose 6-phosphate synthase